MAATAGIYLGYTGEVSYLSTGTRASWGSLTNGVATASPPASLAVISAVRSVTIPDEYGDADGTTRASLGFRIHIPALREAAIELEIPHQPADAGFQALRTAYNSRATIALAILDAPHTQSGASGLWADFAVMKWEESQPEDKEQLDKITLQFGVSAVPPQAVAVT